MKQFIALILTLSVCVSCVTPSHTFLAKKHDVNDREIKMIQESECVSTYSPYFDLKDLVNVTSKGITEENYDSIKCVYNNLQKITPEKINCMACDVLYKFKNDTIKQRIYFLNNSSFNVIHDKDIIIKMERQIKYNLYRFNVNKN